MGILKKREARGWPINHDWTYGCTILILPSQPGLLIAPGPPDQVEFHLFEFYSNLK